MEKGGAAPTENPAIGKVSKLAEMARFDRAEVDTSAPFESVKEAVNRFGGSAVWKSQLKQFSDSEKHHSVEGFELMNVLKQAVQLENHLILKEQETLEVLKELESTRRTIDTLRVKLHELSEMNNFHETCTNEDLNLVPATESEEQIANCESVQAGTIIPSRKTIDLFYIQASIELLNPILEDEKISIEKIRENISAKIATLSSIEDDLKQMIPKIQSIKDLNDRCNGDPASTSIEVKNLVSQREFFRQAAETAKSESLKLTAEIDRIKVSIKASEIRFSAAKMMEEAARASEAAALSQCEALINCSSSTSIVLPIEEYDVLIREIREADESSRVRIECTMLELETENQRKLQVFAKIKEAEADEKASKKFLKDAMNRAEVATSGKLAAEEELRRWRSELGERRRNAHNSIKFKSSYSGHPKRDSGGHNGLNLLNGISRNGLKNHTLSIGEILGRKLVGQGEDDDYVQRSNEQIRVSLGQILSRRCEVLSPQTGCGAARKRHLPVRKRLGLVLFSHALRNERLKNKKWKKNMKREYVSSSR